MFLSSITWRQDSVTRYHDNKSSASHKMLRVRNKKRKTSSLRKAVSDAESAHLTDVLAEGGVGDHLAQEVQVRRHQRHDATADEHRHVLLVSQSHVLHRQFTVTSHYRCLPTTPPDQHRGNWKGPVKWRRDPSEARAVCVCVGLLTFCFDVISV